MANEPRYDFPAVSKGTPEPAKRGETRQEDIFEYDDDKDWKKGESGPKIGSVRLNHSKEADPPSTVRAEFAFDNGETVTFEGNVPGNGSWKGKGRFEFRDGTGKFKGRGEALAVDSVNPKRWG
jgi:hypothetical protein